MKRLSLTGIPGRLDKALAAACPDLTRSRLQALIKQGHVRVAGEKITAPSHRLKGGESMTVTLPAPAPARPKPEKIPLNIVYEDAHLLVIDKPAGMVAHPAAGHAGATLVNALLHHCGASLSGIGGVTRPGIVHRLDKDTSGLMVVAKHDAAHRGLCAQFAGRRLARDYTVFVFGVPKKASGVLEGAIGRSPANRKKMAVTKTGKPAVTHYRVEKSFGLYAARLACTLETGRTHQIRVHLAAEGHGVIGDPVYGRASGRKKSLAKKERNAAPRFPRQALHAVGLRFIHPVSGKAMRFESPLPADLRDLEKALDRLAYSRVP